VSISNYLEENFLKTLRGGGNGTNYTAPAAVYVKLHTGDPGEDGTGNAAGETTRQAVTFAAPANPGGTMASNAAVSWTNVSTSETYSHASLWDHVSAGNCLWTGALTVSKAVTAGDNATFASGAITVTLA
jgi:hypothetical protein